MRMISFALTTAQFLNGTKTVTRRSGWKFLKPGTRLMAVKKTMGLKKGEKVEKLGALEVLSVKVESLHEIAEGDAAKEGFPDLTEDQFVDMFAKHAGCKFDTKVTRIEFRRLALRCPGCEVPAIEPDYEDKDLGSRFMAGTKGKCPGCGLELVVDVTDDYEDDARAFLKVVSS